LKSDELNAFCTDSDAFLEGAATGPLAGIGFAAKDIFDVAGHVTGGGNPDWKRSHGPASKTAWAVQVLVDAGATMVGKTMTDELTRGILGENAHYGTPVNPRAPDRVPGGSSSGSASAVAGGLVDFALGSDTGGSVRAPAAFCGIYGMRPSHGRIPLDGVMPNAPCFDTVGWFARDAELLARVGAVLLQTEISVPPPRRLVIAYDAFEQADPEVREALQPSVDALAAAIGTAEHGRMGPVPLEEYSAHFAVLQGPEAWRAYRDWIEELNPAFSFEVAARFTAGSAVTDEQIEAARAFQDLVVRHVDGLLDERTVLCLPTMPFPAPPKSMPYSQRRAVHDRIDALTDTAGLAGLPQLNLPLADVDGLPAGLSLIGQRGSDEMLMSVARELGRQSTAQKQRKDEGRD
jgi:amidase